MPAQPAPHHLTKSHGLGNDYLVADPAALPFELTPARVRLLCDRHRGVGSDGILLLAEPRPGAEASLRIFNTDGSEAEKSGNGIRIFARWLFDTGRVPRPSFRVATPGGVVPVEVVARSGRVESVVANLGRATFRDDLQTLVLDGETLPVVALTIGNPHCVVIRDTLEVADLRRLGARIETHAAFPQRTNVQLARAVDRGRVEALVWERGAGETLASGTSACAVAAACYRLGLVDEDVTVAMPGGALKVRLGDEGHLWLDGPVEEIAWVTLSPDLLDRLRAVA